MTSSPVSRIAAGANRLASKSGLLKPLPSLLFLTDPARTPDPVAVAQNLPRGSGVILRHYEEPGREGLALALAKICKRRGLVFLVGSDAALARRVGADGIHLPEALLNLSRGIRLRHSNWLITGAAHGSQGLRRAARSGVDAALLAPVFGTASHPGRAHLGPLRFRALLRGASIPIYGLGGISGQTIRRLQGAKLAGVAVIGAAIGEN